MTEQNQPQPQPSGRVRVHIADHTGNKQREARLAANADVGQLIPALVTALALPLTDPSGRPITYHLAFNNRQLQRSETLASAGVNDGSGVSLVPEMTAGSGGHR